MTEPPPRLLYIDDDEGFARLLARNLGRMGFDVLHAADGARGLAFLEEREFDVIALDHYMPGLSGEQTLERIVAMPDPPPVVYVTASDETLVAVSALKAGAADYVIKDVGSGFFELLAAILNQALDRARLRRAEEAAQAEVAIARERAELLLREVNHRVANSLTLVVSMAHLQISSMPQGEARETMEDFASKVYAIAQVHKRLYSSEDIRAVPLHTYLAQLVRDLHRGIVTQKSLTRITFECIPLTVSIDRAISIGVILSELITNAGKYAYPAGSRGEVRVEIRDAGDGDAVMLVEDDGVGIPSARSTGSGLGSQIMEALAQGLGGTLDLQTGPDGTRAALRFPKTEDYYDN